VASQFALSGHLLGLVLKDPNRGVLHVNVLEALGRRLEEDALGVGPLGGPGALWRRSVRLRDHGVRHGLRLLNFLELTLDGLVDHIVVLARRRPLLAFEDPLLKALGVGAEGA